MQGHVRHSGRSRHECFNISLRHTRAGNQVRKSDDGVFLISR